MMAEVSWRQAILESIQKPSYAYQHDRQLMAALRYSGSLDYLSSSPGDNDSLFLTTSQGWAGLRYRVRGPQLLSMLALPHEGPQGGYSASRPSPWSRQTTLHHHLATLAPGKFFALIVTRPGGAEPLTYS